MRRRALVALLAVVAPLAVAGTGSAQEVVLRDDDGRAMRFDVRADVDLAWYAGLLRRAAHGDEIERVTVVIAGWGELRERCTRAAAGCYVRRRGNRGVMVVPAGRGAEVAQTVLHEYGHHVDASRSHGGLGEPNGTPLWWKARGMAELVAVQSVRDRYQVGWERSIGEVFAEDYAYTNLHGRYRIAWLERPSQLVQRAIRADLGLEEPPAIGTVRPALRPVLIVREGTLAPDERVTVGFGLLGPNRRVLLRGLFDAGDAARGRIDVTCGAVPRTRTVGGTAAVSLELARAGPGQCRASIANTGAGPARFRFTVRLALVR